MSIIKNNILKVQEEIISSAMKVKRDPDQVKLICVTKTQPIFKLQEAFKGGRNSFGENKVQELVEKWPEFTNRVEWHLIGHLQTNKVKYLVDKVSLIHSLDRLSLAQEISKKFSNVRKSIDVLVQVNVAKEETKSGLELEETIDFITEVKDYPGLNIKGLMTMAPFTTKPEEVRYVFRDLRLLKEKINNLAIPKINLIHLSMGMTNDYQIAIEEGATLIRVGSGIFGERTY